MIHFSALDYSLWSAGFALSLTVARMVFSRHRGIWPLWALLSCWALGDLAQFAAHFFGLHVYALAYFASSVPLFICEFMLIATLCGVLIKEHRGKVTRYAGAFGVAAGLFVAWRHHLPLLNVPSILTTELFCCGAMGLMLIVAWLAMVELLNREVAQPWPWIVAGAVVLVTFQAASFGLQAHFGLRHWGVISQVRPVGELLALVVWNYAARQRVPVLMRVERWKRAEPVSDQGRKPIVSVKIVQPEREWVM